MQKARESYLRNVELDPQNPVPQFAVGNIDWTIVADGNSGLSTAEKNKLIEEGLQYLKQALALNPDYDGAMWTMSLLYRQKAAIVDIGNEKIKLEAEASSWETKSLETRKKIPEKK